MNIIDLMDDYFLIKFSAFVDYEFTLTKGPWLIFDHYLIVRPWDPEFDPKQDIITITKLAIWIRLLGLNLKYYDQKFLTLLGNKVGKTLKVDDTTMD